MRPISLLEKGVYSIRKKGHGVLLVALKKVITLRLLRLPQDTFNSKLHADGLAIHLSVFVFYNLLYFISRESITPLPLLPNHNHMLW